MKGYKLKSINEAMKEFETKDKDISIFEAKEFDYDKFQKTLEKLQGNAKKAEENYTDYSSGEQSKIQDAHWANQDLMLKFKDKLGKQARKRNDAGEDQKEIMSDLNSKFADYVKKIGFADSKKAYHDADVVWKKFLTAMENARKELRDHEGTKPMKISGFGN